MYKINKENLLAESQKLGFDEVGLEAIFESLGIEDEAVQTQLQEAFVLASRNGAVKLVESHLTAMAEYAQTEVDTLVAQAGTDYEAKLVEGVENLLTDVSKTWLTENQLAVSNTVKAEQFDSLVTDLKESLIQHNFSIPEDKVDLYEELASNERETHAMADNLFRQNVALKEELQTMKRDSKIDDLCVNMTESQSEKFKDLALSMKLDEGFEGKLEVLAESFVSGFSTKPKTKEAKTPEQIMVEGMVKGSTVDTSTTEPAVETNGQPNTQPLKESFDENLIRNMY